MTAERITPDDIRSKLEDIRGEVDQATDSARPVALIAGVGVGVVLLVGVYLLGRRKGKKRSTIVEIRRV